MTRNDVTTDIAYLRELAESGERAPLTGGRFAVLWGTLASLVMLTHWAIVTGRLPLGLESLWVLWLGFIVIGSAGSAVLGMTMSGKPGLGSAGNRVSATVWPAAGAGILLYFIGVTAGTLLGLLGPVFFNTILPVALLGYGIAWVTIARIAHMKLLMIPGAIALLGMTASVIVVTTAEVYLVAAATVFLSTVLPGLVMMRAEPGDTA